MRLSDSLIFTKRKIVAIISLCVVALALIGIVSLNHAQSITAAFDDTKDNTFANEIQSLDVVGILDGTGCNNDDHNFCPEDPMKRWHLAVWMVRFKEGEPEAITSSSFDDVDVDEWWAAHVERLVDLKITIGCDDDNFCPTDNVTRAQMASFLSRALDLPDAESAGFTDVDADNVHLDNINKITSAGITQGCSTTPYKYCPDNSITKGQAAAMISRAIDYEGANASGSGSTKKTKSYDDPTAGGKIPATITDAGPKEDILLGSLFLIGIAASVSCVRIWYTTYKRQNA